MVTQGLTLPTARDAWQDWEAERLIHSLRRLYPTEAGNRFLSSHERWVEVANRVGNIEAIQMNDSLGPTNNARMKFLVALVQAHVNIGEPRADQIDTLVRDMITNA